MRNREKPGFVRRAEGPSDARRRRPIPLPESYHRCPTSAAASRHQSRYCLVVASSMGQH
jgi:hypothetical protein